jgi:hypothetical protein
MGSAFELSGVEGGGEGVPGRGLEEATSKLSGTEHLLRHGDQ